MVVASIGSSATSFIGQSQAASASADYQASRYAAVSVAAQEAYEYDIQQLNKRSIQEIAASQQTGLQNIRQSEQSVGTIRAAAGSGNVAGQSVEDVAREFRQLEAENTLAIQTNLKHTLDQNNAQLRGSRASAQNRINSALPSPVQNPSVAGLGFDLLSAGLNGFLLSKSLSPPGDG